MQLNKFFNTLLLSFIGLFLFFGMSSPHAEDAIPSKEIVKNLLLGYEWKLNPTSFERLGDTTYKTLIQIVEDPAPLPNYFRLRALEALRLYPNSEVESFLEKYIKSQTSQSSSARIRRAFQSFSIAFTPSQPAKVELLAASLLGHPDAHVRLGAVQQLKRLGTDSSLRLLRLQRTQETGFVRDAIDAQ